MTNESERAAFDKPSAAQIRSQATDKQDAFARKVWEYMNSRSCPGVIMQIAYEAVLCALMDEKLLVLNELAENLANALVDKSRLSEDKRSVSIDTSDAYRAAEILRNTPPSAQLIAEQAKAEPVDYGDPLRTARFKQPQPTPVVAPQGVVVTEKMHMHAYRAFLEAADKNGTGYDISAGVKAAVNAAIKAAPSPAEDKQNEN